MLASTLSSSPNIEITSGSHSGCRRRGQADHVQPAAIGQAQVGQQHVHHRPRRLQPRARLGHRARRWPPAPAGPSAARWRRKNRASADHPQRSVHATPVWFSCSQTLGAHRPSLPRLEHSGLSATHKPPRPPMNMGRTPATSHVHGMQACVNATSIATGTVRPSVGGRQNPLSGETMKLNYANLALALVQRRRADPGRLRRQRADVRHRHDPPHADHARSPPRPAPSR